MLNNDLIWLNSCSLPNKAALQQNTDFFILNILYVDIIINVNHWINRGYSYMITSDYQALLNLIVMCCVNSPFFKYVSTDKISLYISAISVSTASPYPLFFPFVE